MAIHWEPVGDGRVLAVSDDHRFGTDAVILSYFAAPPKAEETVCDLGTGCGCIPFLLLNQAAVPRYILGVDKQPDAIMLCRLSADKNKLHGTLQFTEADWCFPKTIAAAGSFDRVVRNPPYFQNGSGRKSSSAAHCTARHEQADTLSAVCAAARYLLRYSGHFCLCHRPERLADVFAALREGCLEPKVVRFVQRRSDTAPWLALIDAVKCGRPSLTVPAPYILEDENGFTDTYKEIYGKYRNT